MVFRDRVGLTSKRSVSLGKLLRDISAIELLNPLERGGHISSELLDQQGRRVIVVCGTTVPLH